MITNARDSDDLSIGFDRGRKRRQLELINNEDMKGKTDVRIYLKDIFGSVEHQEKATSGIGNQLAITRKVGNAVRNKDNATIVGKIKIFSIEWYVPHYTTSISN